MINTVKNLFKKNRIVSKLSAISILLILLISVMLIIPQEEKNKVSSKNEIDYTIVYDAANNAFYKNSVGGTVITAEELTALKISGAKDSTTGVSTLTLNGCDIKSTAAMALNIVGDVTINVEDGTENNITLTCNIKNKNVYGIKANSNVTIIGEGNLDVELKEAIGPETVSEQYEYIGIRIDKNLNIDCKSICVKMDEINNEKGVYIGVVSTRVSVSQNSKITCNIEGNGNNIVGLISEVGDVKGIIDVNILNNTYAGEDYTSSLLGVSFYGGLNIGEEGKNIGKIDVDIIKCKAYSNIVAIYADGGCNLYGAVVDINIINCKSMGTLGILGVTGINSKKAEIKVNIEDSKEVNTGMMVPMNSCILEDSNVYIVNTNNIATSEDGIGIEAEVLKVSGGNVSIKASKQAIVADTFTVDKTKETTTSSITEVVCAATDVKGTECEIYNEANLATYKHIIIDELYDYMLSYDAKNGILNKVDTDGNITPLTIEELPGWEIKPENSKNVLVLKGIDFGTTRSTGIAAYHSGWDEFEIRMEEGTVNNITVYNSANSSGAKGIEGTSGYVCLSGTGELNLNVYSIEGITGVYNSGYKVKDCTLNMNLRTISGNGSVNGFWSGGSRAINMLNANINIQSYNKSGRNCGTYLNSSYGVIIDNTDFNIDIETYYEGMGIFTNSNSLDVRNSSDIDIDIKADKGDYFTSADVDGLSSSYGEYVYVTDSKVDINISGNDYGCGIENRRPTGPVNITNADVKIVMDGTSESVNGGTYGIFSYPSDATSVGVVNISNSVVDVAALRAMNVLTSMTNCSITEGRTGETVVRPGVVANITTYDYALIEPNYYLRFDSSTGKMYISETGTEASVSGWRAELDESTGKYTLVLDGLKFRTNNDIGIKLAASTVIDVADNSENMIKISCASGFISCAAIMGTGTLDIQMGGKLDISVTNLGTSTSKILSGIYLEGACTISGKSATNKGSLNIKVGADDDTSAQMAYGIITNSSLIINNASIDDISMKAKIISAIEVSNNTITISNSKVHMPNLVSTDGECQIITAGKGMTVDSGSDIYINYKDIDSGTDGEHYDNYHTIICVKEGELVVDKSDIKMDISMGAGFVLDVHKDDFKITESTLDFVGKIDEGYVLSSSQGQLSQLYKSKITIENDLFSERDNGIYKRFYGINTNRNFDENIVVPLEIIDCTISMDVKGDNEDAYAIYAAGELTIKNVDKVTPEDVYDIIINTESDFGETITAYRKGTINNVKVKMDSDYTNNLGAGTAIYAREQLDITNSKVEICSDTIGNQGQDEIKGIYVKKDISIIGSQVDIDIDGVKSKAIYAEKDVNITNNSVITMKGSSEEYYGIYSNKYYININDSTVNMTDIISDDFNGISCEIIIESEAPQDETKMNYITINKSNINIENIKKITDQSISTGIGTGWGDLTIDNQSNINIDIETRLIYAIVTYKDLIAKNSNITIHATSDIVNSIGEGIKSRFGKVDIDTCNIKTSMEIGEATSIVSTKESDEGITDDIVIKNSKLDLINGRNNASYACGLYAYNKGVVTDTKVDIYDNAATCRGVYCGEGFTSTNNIMNIKTSDNQSSQGITTEDYSEEYERKIIISGGQVLIQSGVIIDGVLDVGEDTNFGVVSVSTEYDGSVIEGYNSSRIMEYKYILIGEICDYAYKYYPLAGQLYAYGSDAPLDDTNNELSNIGVSIINDGTANVLCLESMNLSTDREVALWIIGDAYVQLDSNSINNLVSTGTSKSNYYGIKATGNINLSGYGTLSCNKTEASVNNENYYGIYSNKNILIEEALVNLSDNKTNIIVGNSATTGSTYGIYGENVGFKRANVSVQVNEDNTSSVGVYADNHGQEDKGKIAINDGGLEIRADKVTNVVPTYTNVAITGATNISNGANVWPGVVANTTNYKYVLVQPNYYLNYNASNGKMFISGTSTEANVAGWRTDTSTGKNVLVLDGLNFVTSALYGINMAGTATITIADGSKNTLRINHFANSYVHGINSSAVQVINGSGELIININNNIEGAAYKAQYVKGIVSTNKLQIYDCKLKIDAISDGYKGASIYSNTAIDITETMLDLNAKGPLIAYNIYAYNEGLGDVNIKSSKITGRVESRDRAQGVSGLRALTLEDAEIDITCIGNVAQHFGFYFQQGIEIKNAVVHLNNEGGYGRLIYSSTEENVVIDNSRIYLDLDTDYKISYGINNYSGGLEVTNNSYIEFKTESTNPTTYKCDDESCLDDHYYNHYGINVNKDVNIKDSTVKINGSTTNLDGIVCNGNLTVDHAVVNMEQLKTKCYSAYALGSSGRIDIKNESDIDINYISEEASTYTSEGKTYYNYRNFVFRAIEEINVDNSDVYIKTNVYNGSILESYDGGVTLTDSSVVVDAVADNLMGIYAASNVTIDGTKYNVTVRRKTDENISGRNDANAIIIYVESGDINVLESNMMYDGNLYTTKGFVSSSGNINISQNSVVETKVNAKEFAFIDEEIYYFYTDEYTEMIEEQIEYMRQYMEEYLAGMEEGAEKEAARQEAEAYLQEYNLAYQEYLQDKQEYLENYAKNINIDSAKITIYCTLQDNDEGTTNFKGIYTSKGTVLITGNTTVVDMNATSDGGVLNGIENKEGIINITNGVKLSIDLCSEGKVRGVVSKKEGNRVLVTSSDVEIYTGDNTADAIAIDADNLSFGQTREYSSEILEASSKYKIKDSEGNRGYIQGDIIAYPGNNSDSYKYVKIGNVNAYSYVFDVDTGTVEKQYTDGEADNLVTLPSGLSVSQNAYGKYDLNMNGFDFMTTAPFAIWICSDSGDTDAISNVNMTGTNNITLLEGHNTYIDSDSNGSDDGKRAAIYSRNMKLLNVCGDGSYTFTPINKVIKVVTQVGILNSTPLNITLNNYIVKTEGACCASGIYGEKSITLDYVNFDMDIDNVGMIIAIYGEDEVNLINTTYTLNDKDKSNEDMLSMLYGICGMGGLNISQSSQINIDANVVTDGLGIGLASSTSKTNINSSNVVVKMNSEYAAVGMFGTKINTASSTIDFDLTTDEEEGAGVGMFCYSLNDIDSTIDINIKGGHLLWGIYGQQLWDSEALDNDYSVMDLKTTDLTIDLHTTSTDSEAYGIGYTGVITKELEDNTIETEKLAGYINIDGGKININSQAKMPYGINAYIDKVSIKNVEDAKIHIKSSDVAYVQSEAAERVDSFNDMLEDNDITEEEKQKILEIYGDATQNGIGNAIFVPNLEINNSTVKASSNCGAAIAASKSLDTKGYTQASTNYATLDSTPEGLGVVYDLDTNNKSYKYVTIDPSVISVNISWGALDYKFDHGDWNTTTFVYDDRGWKPTTDRGDEITVTNTDESNVPIDASIVYNPVDEYDIITGSMVTNKVTKDTLPASNQVLVGSSLKTYLMLSGELTEDIASQIVGNVTITLAE